MPKKPRKESTKSNTRCTMPEKPCVIQTEESEAEMKENKTENHQSFLCTNFAPWTVSVSSTSYHDWSPTVVREAYAVRDLHLLSLY